MDYQNGRQGSGLSNFSSVRTNYIPSSTDSHIARCSNPTACPLLAAAESDRKAAIHHERHRNMINMNCSHGEMYPGSISADCSTGLINQRLSLSISAIYQDIKTSATLDICHDGNINISRYTQQSRTNREEDNSDHLHRISSGTLATVQTALDSSMASVLMCWTPSL